MRVFIVGWTMVIAWFAYAAFSFIYIVRFQNNLYKRFPDAAKHILGTQKAWGIVNKKLGFSLIRDPEIKELVRMDKDMEKQRKRAVLFWIIFNAFVFLGPALMFPLYYFAWLMSR